MEEVKYYDLNLGQETVKLQLMYTLFDRVVNILFSASKDEMDFDVMEKAYNILVSRHDCLRIRFKKVNKVLKQYFLKEVDYYKVPRLTFSTQKEQEAWINKIRKHGIKFKKGIVIEPYFIKTYDNKFMVFTKLCHLVIDMHGIGLIYKDLFAIYNSLMNNSELPEVPLCFEEDIIKSNETNAIEKNDEKHREFFEKYLSEHEEPTYAGISGNNSKRWLKRVKKGKRSIQNSFFSNTTTCYQFTFDQNVVDKVINYCNENSISMNNLLFYACSITCSLVNNKTNHMLPLLLSNCRGSAKEKKFAGCKVQSLAAFTDIDYNQTFANNLNAFSKNLMSLYRRINFPDTEFEMMLHNIYKSSIFTSYYSITFSFVPYSKDQSVTYDMYSNKRGALPCYISALLDVDTNELRIGYDVQDRLTTEQDTIDFQNKYVEVLNTLIDNPDVPLNELFK